MNYNTDHLKAIDQLGFVHRRLPTGDPRNGEEFVPRSEFDNEGRERMIVRVLATETVLSAVNGNDGRAYSVGFQAATPGNVINQAVAAAMQDARI